jgi:predicted outer membrane protein
MEKLKNHAMLTIVICIITLHGVTQNVQAKNKYINTRKDSLNTEQLIKQLSINSAKEINLAKLAKMKSKNSKIREYAIKAKDAGILIYSDLMTFAAPRNITLADSSTFAPDDTISALQKAKNADFDRRYLSITIEDHNQVIALLEKGAMFGDTAIVSFSNKQLIVFRRNLEEAKYLAKITGKGKITADRPRKMKK